MSMELDALIKAVTEEVMRRLQLPEKKMIIMGQDSEHTLRQCYLKEYQVSLYDRSERACDILLLEELDIAELARISLFAPMNKKRTIYYRSSFSRAANLDNEEWYQSACL